MGHLMQTVNPEVDAPAPDNLPAVGDIVLYRTRPGEGRRGKSEFPAMVIGHNDQRGRYGLDLIVIYDAQDVVFRDSVQAQSEHIDSSCWFVRSNDATALREEVRILREENAALRNAVFGDWNVPEQGLMDYLVDFEKRIKAVEATAKKAQAPAATKGKSKP